MMSRLIRGGLFLAVVGVMSPSVTEAGLFRCLFGHRHCNESRMCNDCSRVKGCCQVCQLPPTQCTCTTFTPVVETCYKQEQHVTYRDFRETHYRQENCVTKVPVTTYTDVTVDEGCYKMIWVPKVVNKKVPCTTYQDRHYSRTIPYQVNRRVPEYTTRWIPQQRFRGYQKQTTCSAGHPVTPGAGGGCTSCGSNGHGQPPFMVPTAPQSPPTPVPNPTPDPEFNQKTTGHPYDQWMPIAPAQSQQRPVSSSRKKSGRFMPAPSAATAWHSRGSLVRP